MTIPAIKNEAYVFQAVIDTINAGLASRAIAGVAVQQWYQPRVIGAPPGMAMLLSNITSHRYGFLARDDKWDAQGEQMTHTERQVNEAHLQLTGWSPAKPAPAALPTYTAGDLADLGARVLASDAGREMLRSKGLGIERITEVRKPYGKDETDQFIGSSSFDFVLSLEQTEATTSPIVTDTVFRMSRV